MCKYSKQEFSVSPMIQQSLFSRRFYACTTARVLVSSTNYSWQCAGTCALKTVSKTWMRQGALTHMHNYACKRCAPRQMRLANWSVRKPFCSNDGSDFECRFSAHIYKCVCVCDQSLHTYHTFFQPRAVKIVQNNMQTLYINVCMRVCVNSLQAWQSRRNELICASFIVGSAIVPHCMDGRQLLCI